MEGKIGPVRSARDQHIQMILPMEALYVHIGASTFARDMLETYHYADKDLDGNSTNVRDVAFWLDEERHKTREIEHCWYTDSSLIQSGIKKYHLDLEREASPVFQFVSYAASPRRLALSGANELHVQFSQSYYSDFSYDSAKPVIHIHQYAVRARGDFGKQNQQVAIAQLLAARDVRLRCAEFCL